MRFNAEALLLQTQCSVAWLGTRKRKQGRARRTHRRHTSGTAHWTMDCRVRLVPGEEEELAALHQEANRLARGTHEDRKRTLEICAASEPHRTVPYTSVGSYIVSSKPVSHYVLPYKGG